MMKDPQLLALPLADAAIEHASADEIREARPANVSTGSSSFRLFKFRGDTGFHREVKRRVLEYFEESKLSTKANARMYVKTAVFLLAFGASYGLLVFVAANWWQTLLLAFSLALAMAGISFAVQHDANHGAYSQHSGINRLIGLSLDLMGASSYVWRWKHNVAHHTYTNLVGADSDIEVPFGRLSPAQPRSGMHRSQHLYLWALYGLFVVHWQLFEDFQQLAKARIGGSRFPRPRGFRLLEFVCGKLLFFGWALILPMFFHPWWLVLPIYLGTSAVLSFVLILVFQLAHSVEESALVAPAPGSQMVPRAWAVHQVEATVDFARGNRWLSWYVGGLNFQIEHHLFSGVCHVHYPRIAPIVEATCAEFGVRYAINETFFGAVLSHWRWLRRMGREVLPCPAKSRFPPRRHPNRSRNSRRTLHPGAFPGRSYSSWRVR